MTSPLSPRVGAALLAWLAALAVLAGCAGPSPHPAGSGPATTASAAVAMSADPGIASTWVEQVHAEADAALVPVGALLPGPWAARVEVRLVATAERLSDEAGWSRSGAAPNGTVAAVAVLPAPGAAVGTTGRLVVDLGVYRRLTATGRAIVLRHELTHLATAAATPAAMPLWLVEGFAEEIGHEGAVTCTASFVPVPGGPRCPEAPTEPLTVTSAAAELASEIGQGRVPVALPDDPAFDGADGGLARTYQQAWLACRLLAQDIGLPGLVAFYRGVAGRLATPGVAPPAAVDAQLRAQTGRSTGVFTSEWRAWLVTLLGAAGGGH